MPQVDALSALGIHISPGEMAPSSRTTMDRLRTVVFTLCIFVAFPQRVSSPAASPERIRHPEDVLAWFQCDIPVLMAHQQKMWNVGLGGLVQGAEYELQVQMSKDGQVMFHEVHPISPDVRGLDATLFPTPIPPMAGGIYKIDLMLSDTFPGLSEDDAFLAAKSQHVEIPEPKSWVSVSTKSIICEEKSLWPPQDRSRGPPIEEGEQISIASVASIDRSLAVLLLLKRWDGPASVVMYARTDEEASAIEIFVRDVLGPFAAEMKKSVHVRLVSMCVQLFEDGGHSSDVFSFPINKLRSEAITNAVTDLVLYLDVDFMPSQHAQAELLAADGIDRVLNGTDVMILPCFSAAQHSTWPAPPAISRREGVLNVEVGGSISKDELRRRWAAEPDTLLVPGEPTNFHSHGAVDYLRWLRADTTEPYVVPYTFLFEPYLVINKRRWGGLYQGLFDQRFLRWGADKAQLAYEAAALGYQFVVHPTAFLIHAPKRPEFSCHAELGRLCEVAQRTVAEWQERSISAWWDYELIDFIVSLPLWEGLPSDGSKGVCYMPPYAFLAQLPRHAAAGLAWQALHPLSKAFQQVGSMLRGRQPYTRADWSKALQRWCFGVAALVGRLSRSEGQVRVLLHREALEGYPLDRGSALVHYTEMGTAEAGWGELRVLQHEEGDMRGSGGMVVAVWPRGSLCDVMVKRELPGWVQCRVVSKSRAASGEETVLSDRVAWIHADEDETRWEGGGSEEDGWRVDGRLMEARVRKEEVAIVEAIRNKEVLSWRQELNKSSDLLDFRSRMQAEERRHSLLPVRISDSLFLSDARAAQNLSRLSLLGITHVLNLAGQFAAQLTPSASYAAAGITLKTMATDDRDGYPMLAAHWHQARRFIARARAEGGQCVVHCVAGLNRAGVVVAADKMVHERLSVLAAVRHCRRARGSSFLWNKSFQEQLVVLARLEGLLGVPPGLPGSVVPSWTDGWTAEEAAAMAALDAEEQRASAPAEDCSHSERGGEQGEAAAWTGGGAGSSIEVELADMQTTAGLPLSFKVRFGTVTRAVEYGIAMEAVMADAVVWAQHHSLEVAADSPHVTLGVVASFSPPVGTLRVQVTVEPACPHARATSPPSCSRAGAASASVLVSVAASDPPSSTPHAGAGLAAAGDVHVCDDGPDAVCDGRPEQAA